MNKEKTIRGHQKIKTVSKDKKKNITSQTILHKIKDLVDKVELELNRPYNDEGDNK